MVADAPTTPSRPATPAHATSKSAVALLALCILVALGVRVFAAARSGLWRDEGLFLFIVQSPSLAEMLDFLRHNESHPPLFYLLMRAWLGIFGDSEAAALALPVLLGVALVPVMYAIGTRVFSRRVGVVAAILTALSPVLVEYSAQVRPYSLLPLLCLLSVYFLWRGLTAGGARSWLGYAAATLALLYTHNWTWLLLGAQWVVVGAALLPPGGRPGRLAARQWLWAQCLVLAGYAVWIPTLLYQARHAGHGAAPLSAYWTTHAIVRAAFGVSLRPIDLLLLALIGLVIWWACRRQAAGRQTGGEERTALLLLIGVPAIAVAAAVILSAKTVLAIERCLMIPAPCVLLAVAYALASAPLNRTRVAAGVVTGILIARYAAGSLQLCNTIKSNAREAAATVAAQARPTDLIVIAPEYLASAFNYYYKPDTPQINYPHEGRQGATSFSNLFGRMADPAALRRVKARLTRARRENRRIWLVVDHNDKDDNVRDDTELPQGITDYGSASIIRANQLRKYLTDLYGGSNLITVPQGGPSKNETLDVFLFERGQRRAG
jgi:uncharacterized membrane protein